MCDKLKLGPLVAGLFLASWGILQEQRAEDEEALDKAQQVLMSALTLEPDQPAALYALGRCQLEQGQVAEASKNLEKAARINRRLPKIDYYLGLAYGKNNQLVDAHYHFGIYYKRRGSLRNAEFHFQEALRLTDDPKEKEILNRELAQIKGALRAAKQKQ